jgi:phospholipase/carboxylesterase
VSVNPHLEAAPVTAGAPLEQAPVAAILVHGRDQGPEFMLELVERLALPEVAYLLPVASGRSWYPERFYVPIERNEPWLTHALLAFEDAFNRVRDAGVPVERIVLVGFSQGACLTAEYVARRPRPYAAVAVLTGALICPDDASCAPRGRLDGLEVFFGTMEQDEWVPLEHVRETVRAFELAGADVAFRVYDDPEHHINDDEVAAVRGLIERAMRREER